MVKIGSRLKTLRRINNIEPKDVIKQLERYTHKKFSLSSLYKWEENVAEPNIYILIELARIYRSSISFILDDTIIMLENLTETEATLLNLYRNNPHFTELSSNILKYCQTE